MTKQDWITLLAPAVATLVLALIGLLAAVISGLTGRLKAYFDAHGQAAAAQAVAEAGTTIQRELMTSASTIAGKIQTGQLDYTNRAALETEALREVAIVQQRAPGALAVAQPVAGALVADIMGKVDRMVLASPTIPTTAPVAPTKPVLVSANVP